MPEIKNTFRLGKMNKDLDERLVPPGEYRDALNVGVGRSEGADVGAVENLLGNELVGPQANPVTLTERVLVTPEVPARTDNVDHSFNVVSYTAAVEGTSGRPASPTQTVRLTEALNSASGTRTAATGDGMSRRQGQVFTVGTVAADAITFTVDTFGATSQGDTTPVVGGYLQNGSPQGTAPYDGTWGNLLSDQTRGDTREITAVTSLGNNRYAVTIASSFGSALGNTAALNIYSEAIRPGTGGIAFEWISGSLFDLGRRTVTAGERILFSDGTNTFLVVFSQTGATLDGVSFTTDDTFSYAAGTTLTFQALYEFADFRTYGGVYTGQQRVSSTVITVAGDRSNNVGLFYGNRQPSVLQGDAPSIDSAVYDAGTGRTTLTLSFDPVDLTDTERGVNLAYQFVYIGGGTATGTPATPANVVVTKVNTADDDPMVREEIIFGAGNEATIDAVAESSGQFTLTLNEDLNPQPTSTDQITIQRQVTTPGTPAVYQTRTTTTTSSIGTCIGSIRDLNTDRIYWFTTSDSYDAVWEFTQSTNTIVPLLRGELNFSTDNLITGVNVMEGLLYWTDDRNEPRKLDIEKWKTQASNDTIPTSIYGRSFQERDITVIRPHPTEGITIDKYIDVESENPPFEEVFPQFAYRWKYDDGEFSPYSAFTEEVFTPAPYDATEHYKEGYNKSIRNIVSNVVLRNIPKGGPDVVQVDILYRESLSRTVYTLKSITNQDPDNWGINPSYLQDQNITKRSFYAALPDNQLSRRYDDVPRRAKAQDITANRLVYGNYLRNYPQNKIIDIATGQNDLDDSGGISIKGNRDYEVGVAYIDQFGREGNLLTSGDVYTSTFSTEASQRLSARVDSSAPSWATHYKYYVKEASMDHHNLVAYNTFNDGESQHNNSEFIWLQFASDDRNKISQDTFLVPRRHTHGELSSTGSNTLGMRSELESTSIFNANHGAVGYVRNDNQRLIWAGDVGFVQGSNSYIGANSPLQNGAYTAPVEGTYNFAFSGDLVFQSRKSRGAGAWDGRAFLDMGVAFQVIQSGGSFDNSTGDNYRTWVDDTWYGIPRIEAPGNPKVSPFGTTYSVDLNAGDQVRPILVRWKNRDRGYVRFTMENVSFRTLTTPPDPNLPAPPIELPGICIPEFSRHKVIEIENEAPDIVRNQLPVELRKLGPTIDYDSSSGNENNRAFLVQNFNVPDAEDTAGYTEASTELYYRAKNSGSGYLNFPLINSLNLIFDREGLGRLRVTDGVTRDNIDPADQTIAIDVSEVEGGLYLGVGFDNELAETGVAGKIRITEIALGFDDDADDSERSILKITLEEPVGIDPINENISFFRGRITENALKNIQGTFFVKVPRATNNEVFPFIPTGQSVFDDENNVSTLQSIWFETLPIENEAPEVNIFWEASESLPISGHGQRDYLDFFNCVALTEDCVFIETQRIYDRFNSVQISKGLKANIPLDNYEEERRNASLIHSGIFNSRTGLNRLNQFIIADRIDKDLEPNYGSIQKLHTRDTDIIVFCEDKIFKVLSDKDLLYNANGGGNVSASNLVLGQTTPYVGEYGISKNPESFASYGSRIYFVDKARGVVMRLAQNGLEEISRYGMSDYFRDNLRSVTGPLWGSYDDYHNLYNIRIGNSTISFDDDTQGFPSRKSFLPESGLSLNNIYYTFKAGVLWVHNSRNVSRNNFYGEQFCSSITTIFNQEPSTIKNFKTLNYEGTGGWTAPLILTDQEAGRVLNFVNKEGKWFECIGALGDNSIVSVINDLMGDGVEDFYDEDSVEGDDGIGGGDMYSFGDDDGSGGGGSDGDGPMGLGDPVDVTDGDGMPVDTDTDTNAPDDVTITFNIVAEGTPETGP